MPSDSSSFLRVSVLGAGAIGAFVGAKLSQHRGVHVTLIGRPSLTAALKNGHLRVNSLAGVEESIAVDGSSLTVTESDASLADCDVVLLCVKSADTAAAGQQIKRAAAGRRAGHHIVIVSLQNGIDNPTTLRMELIGPQFIVLAGTVDFNVVWNEDLFRQTTDGKLYIEAPVDENKGAEIPIVTALQTAGLATTSRSDMQAIQRGKLLVNFTNAINLLSGVPIKAMLMNRMYRHVWVTAIEEGVSVFKAARLKVTYARVPLSIALFTLRLPDVLFKQAFKPLAQMDEHTLSSMAQDVQRGRRTEVDHLLGPCIALGKQHQVPTPVLTALHLMVKEAEKAKRSPQVPAHELARRCGIVTAPRVCAPSTTGAVGVVVLAVVFSLVPSFRALLW